MNPHEIIHEILLDMSLHPLIEDGMVNFSNKVHLRILEEKLTSFGMSKKDVSEIIDNVIEGQFPDRQAYNKEGWLVTFPSPEYKQAAIKKGTHFASDPTHGKGGMNLYYKKKGKQARMTQQDPSAVEPEEPAQAGGTTGRLLKLVRLHQQHPATLHFLPLMVKQRNHPQNLLRPPMALSRLLALKMVRKVKPLLTLLCPLLPPLKSRQEMLRLLPLFPRLLRRRRLCRLLPLLVFQLSLPKTNIGAPHPMANGEMPPGKLPLSLP